MPRHPRTIRQRIALVGKELKADPPAARQKGREGSRAHLEGDQSEWKSRCPLSGDAAVTNRHAERRLLTHFSHWLGGNHASRKSGKRAFDTTHLLAQMPTGTMGDALLAGSSCEPSRTET